MFLVRAGRVYRGTRDIAPLIPNLIMCVMSFTSWSLYTGKITPVSTQAIIVVLSLLSVLELGRGISSAAGYGYVAVTQLTSKDSDRVH